MIWNSLDSRFRGNDECGGQGNSGASRDGMTCWYSKAPIPTDRLSKLFCVNQAANNFNWPFLTEVSIEETLRCPGDSFSITCLICSSTFGLKNKTCWSISSFCARAILRIIASFSFVPVQSGCSCIVDRCSWAHQAKCAPRSYLGLYIVDIV